MDMQALFGRLGGIKGVGGDKLNPMTEGEIAAIEAELGVDFPEVPSLTSWRATELRHSTGRHRIIRTSCFVR